MINEESAKRCLNALMKDVLDPAFLELETETGQQITVEVRVVAPTGMEAIRRGLGEGLAASGEVRVALRESLAGSVNFVCQAVIRGLKPSSGFSGFSMQGKVDLASTGDSVRLKARTNHYNQWEWRPEFAVAQNA